MKISKANKKPGLQVALGHNPPCHSLQEIVAEGGEVERPPPKAAGYGPGDC